MTDNCPECLQQSVAPIAGHCAGDQTSHVYHCPRCGHVWTTNRLQPIAGAGWNEHEEAA